MDLFTFIATLTKALAWPIVVLIVVLVFKDKLAELIAKVEELKVLGAELKFASKLRAVVEETKEIIKEENIQPPVLTEADVEPAPAETDEPNPHHVIRMATGNGLPNSLFLVAQPKAGFSIARRRLEQTIVEAYARPRKLSVSLAQGLGVSTEQMLSELRSKGLITSRALQTIKDLLAIGNNGAHGTFEPTFENARDYVGSVASIMEVLNNPRKTSLFGTNG